MLSPRKGRVAYARRHGVRALKAVASGLPCAGSASAQRTQTCGAGAGVVYWGSKRVSYNGYYVSFPRMRREFDSLHPHQRLSEVFFWFLGLARD